MILLTCNVFLWRNIMRILLWLFSLLFIYLYASYTSSTKIQNALIQSRKDISHVVVTYCDGKTKNYDGAKSTSCSEVDIDDRGVVAKDVIIPLAILSWVVRQQ